MTTPTQPTSRNGFEVAIVCALKKESNAVEVMFDAFFDDDGDKYGKAAGDKNQYTTGRIGNHNVVLVLMPEMGKASAATTAATMGISFPSIKLALLVGICGALPRDKDNGEILLGDIIISSRVVQYDFGSQYPGGFRRKDSADDNLDRANREIRSLVQKLEGGRSLDLLTSNTSTHLNMVLAKSKYQKWKYPGIDKDWLFQPKYRHMHHPLPDGTSCLTCQSGDGWCDSAINSSCADLGCSEEMLIPRDRLTTGEDSLLPQIHVGIVASGDRVMKSGEVRDSMSGTEKVIAFEMEGAGAWDSLPCIVLKGVCDYADSHKKKLWQEYAAISAAACMKALLKQWTSTDKLLEQTGASKRPFLIPFGRNSNFVGRAHELDRLMKIFLTEDKGDNCQHVALDGLGGIGKTHIAVEFAYRLKKQSSEHAIFWVQASDLEAGDSTSFENSYRKIGAILGILGINEEKADVKNLTKEWLSKESNGKWILIIDNADDPQLFRGDNELSLTKYLPYSKLGGILFTTRNHKIATDHAEAEVITIREMTDSEARELLQASVQNKEILDDIASVSKLLELLVYLPLALKQAVAYLNSNSTTIAKYIKIFGSSNDQQISLLSQDFGDASRYKGTKNPLATTWLISFEQINRQNELAASYMAFMSCIQENNIPQSLLPKASESEQVEAIGTLIGFGFVTAQLSKDTFDMHRLVHITMRNWLRIEQKLQQEMFKAIHQVAAAFPWPEHENRSLWIPYLPHGEHIIDVTKVFDIKETIRWNLLDKLGRSFWLTRKDMKCLERCKEALELKQSVLGNYHSSTLMSAMYIASSLRNQGNYTEAVKMYQGILPQQKNVLGKEHPETLKSMSNLAEILSSQGKYAEAEKMNRETLALREKVSGKKHPDTLMSMNNLAEVLSSQGKYAEAEKMHRETLALREKVSGKKHPDTLASMNNLAEILSSQGKYAEAEKMNRETLALREKVSGKKHPDTLTSMNNLALTLDSQGKYAEAEAMYRETLALREKVLGREHPHTLTSMNNLAGALDSQGKYAEAEKMYRETLALSEKVLGKEHPSTLTNMNNLAGALNGQGKYAKAEAIHRETLALRQKVLGEEHPETQLSREWIAFILSNQGRYTEAEEMHQETLALKEKISKGSY